MRKLRVLLIMILGFFVLVACEKTPDVVLENEAKDFYLTGNHNGWGVKEGFKMEAIKLSDERVASLKKQLKGVEALYIIEVTLPAEEPEPYWGEKYLVDGQVVDFHGNLTIKLIRTNKGETIADVWMPSPESGALENLTPDTLVMPLFRAEADIDQASETDRYLGHSNSNPVAKEAGTYYVIYAEKGSGREAVRYLGLIKKV